MSWEETMNKILTVLAAAMVLGAATAAGAAAANRITVTGEIIDTWG